MIKAIIFDFSGVLTITEARHKYIQSWADKIGISYSNLRKYLYGGESWAEFITGQITSDDYIYRVLSELHLPMTHEMRILREPFLMDDINNDVLNIVQSLNSDYTTGLMSNAPISLRAQLDKERILAIMNPVIISAEVGIRKPDLAIYEVLLTRLGLTPESCVFIDDKERYLVPARELRINTIHFLSPNQLKEELTKLL